MSAIKDLIGQNFGKLKVLSRAKNINGRVTWNCMCECGKTTIRRTGDLTRKDREISCGKCNEVNDTMIYEYKEDYVIGYSKTNRKFLIDKEDLNKIKGHCISVDARGYVRVSIEGDEFSLHRLLMNPNKDEIVDHINRNPFDNRKSNLRVCNTEENLRNLSISKNNKTGVPGVFYLKKRSKFRAEITVNYNKLYLGEFKKFEDAVKVRKNAEIKYFGEFAPEY